MVRGYLLIVFGCIIFMALVFGGIPAKYNFEEGKKNREAPSTF